MKLQLREYGKTFFMYILYNRTKKSAPNLKLSLLKVHN